MSYPVDDLTTGGGFTWRIIAGETLEKYKLVCFCSPNKIIYADASSESTMPAIALTMERIPAGTKGKILFIGIVNNNDWHFTPKSLLYVSSTPGEITVNPPMESGDQVQVIGQALTQTLIIIHPSYVLVEVA